MGALTIFSLLSYHLSHLVSFGANWVSFGANWVSCGANSVSFGANSVSFGANSVSFDANWNLFVANRHEKGEQLTFISLNFWSFIVSIKTCTYQKFPFFNTKFIF